MFKYDVFLSHSSKDQVEATDLAERLRADGLRIWLYNWDVRPEDDIPAMIEDGLENSRVLVLCLSINANGPEWTQLEAGTFRFRDPLSRERRFIPLRLDGAPVDGSLAQYLHISWLPRDREREYPRLLSACRPPAKLTTMATRGARKRGGTVVRLDYDVTEYAFSADGARAITASSDGTLRLWDISGSRRKRSVRVLRGHTAEVTALAWSADGHRAVSGSSDRTVRLWDVDKGSCLRVYKGHTTAVSNVTLSADGHSALSCTVDSHLLLWDLLGEGSLSGLDSTRGSVIQAALSPDGHYALAGSDRQTLHLWNLATGSSVRPFHDKAGDVHRVIWSADQLRAVTGTRDGSIQLWDVKRGRSLRILEGHKDAITSLAWSRDQRYVLSGSSDLTVRLWDLRTGICLRVLEGHTAIIRTVAWAGDGLSAISGDSNGSIRRWDLSALKAPGAAPILGALSSAGEAQIQYTNAKVLLVGDSGVGKTGLAQYLALGVRDEERLSSTDGAWATQWTIPQPTRRGRVDQEIWLWDFAGQVDYRLVHQLFMDDTAAAVLVFNPQDENPFDGLGQWDRDLQKATRAPFAKLLTAGRVDRGGLVVSRSSVDRFMLERGFLGPLHETSAKTGEGCDDLRTAIVDAIEWTNIPETTSPALYLRMKQEILRLRDSGLVLIRLAELKQRMDLSLGPEGFDLAQLETVVSLLAGPGIIQRVDFGGFILLRPEVLSRYAAAVVRKVRKHPQELGCIREDEMLAGELDYQDFDRLSEDDEAVLLRILDETFVSRAWCLRQPYDGTALLTFPSYFRRERPEQVTHPSVVVTYRFAGPVDDIYATLVVRLQHTEAFETDQLWRLAADFRTQTGKSLGLKLTREPEGTALLEVYFSPDVETDSRVIFLRYIDNHLTQYGQRVIRLRHYSCANIRCQSNGQRFTDQTKIDRAVAPEGKGQVFCSDCGSPILLRDLLESKFESPEVMAEARQLQQEGQEVLDNESQELRAVHHTGFIVAEAGQIYRGYTNSDHGIDGEIEFRDDLGRASGQRLYVQIKSGDSYLAKRNRDSAEIFHIKNARWAAYWQKQAYPVMLVIRSSDGAIRWMDVSSYLKDKRRQTGYDVKQVVFAGERLDPLSVRRWRRLLLGSSRL